MKYVIASLVFAISVSCLALPSIPAASATVPLSLSSGTSGAPSTVQPSACARVVTSLHLRESPSPDSNVITWLFAGQVVTVYSGTSGTPEWLIVDTGNQVGYSRAKYLESIDCNKRKTR